MEERLYPIPGYEGLYSITKSGRVLSHRDWNGHGDRWMIPGKGSGRGNVILTKNGKTVHRGINSLLRETFNKRPSDMRPIPDTNDMYWISREGVVWSEYSHSIIKSTLASTNATVCTIGYTYGRRVTNTRTMAEKVFEDELPPMVPINGSDGRYGITTDGRVYSYVSRRFLKPTPGGTSPYLEVSLCINGERKTSLVHRLVANAYIPNPMNLPQLAHHNCYSDYDEEGAYIILGLNCIAGVGNTQIPKDSPKDFKEFLKVNINMNKTVLSNLVKAGVFKGNRDEMLQYIVWVKDKRKSKGEFKYTPTAYNEQMEESKVMGMSFGDIFSKYKMDLVNNVDIFGYEVLNVKGRKTKTGKNMAFVKVRDNKSVHDLVIFNDRYKDIKAHNVYIMKVRNNRIFDFTEAKLA